MVHTEVLKFAANFKADHDPQPKSFKPSSTISEEDESKKESSAANRLKLNLKKFGFGSQEAKITDQTQSTPRPKTERKRKESVDGKSSTKSSPLASARSGRKFTAEPRRPRGMTEQIDGASIRNISGGRSSKSRGGPRKYSCDQSSSGDISHSLGYASGLALLKCKISSHNNLAHGHASHPNDLHKLANQPIIEVSGCVSLGQFCTLRNYVLAGGSPADVDRNSAELVAQILKRIVNTIKLAVMSISTAPPPDSSRAFLHRLRGECKYGPSHIDTYFLLLSDGLEWQSSHDADSPWKLVQLGVVTCLFLRGDGQTCLNIRSQAGAEFALFAFSGVPHPFSRLKPTNQGTSW